MTKITPIRIHAIKDELRPAVATEGSAAIDLRVYVANRSGFITLQPGESATLGTGLYVEIPIGWCGLIIPRSGLGSKGLHLKNVTGLIDADYRGEIKMGLINKGTEEFVVSDFDRVAQMVVVPHYPHVLEFVDSVDQLSETDRGAGGFGHSGKQ